MNYILNMDLLLVFAKKKWLYINWILSVSMYELKREFRANENLKKEYALKKKKKNWMADFIKERIIW